MSTPFLDQVYEQVTFERDLVFRFFTVFSLFEYALKSTTYKRLANGKVEVMWDSFARDISPNFVPNPGSELEAAVNYLMISPPKKQILNAMGRISFENPVVRPANITNDTVWLSQLIRRVRNNLFHGGKFEFDPVRDTQLLNHSLTILEAWAQLHPDVEQALRNAQ
jgi:hypothetical protein